MCCFVFADWRSQFYDGLRQRNRLQRDNYTDIVEACQTYTQHHAHNQSAALASPHPQHSASLTSSFVSFRADQTLLERYTALRARQRDNDNQSSASNSSHGSNTPPFNLSTASASSADTQSLRDKLSRLQEELTNSYRLQAENNATSLRLKEQSERDEKQLIAKEDDVGRMKREVEALRQDMARLKEEKERKERLLESTVELVRNEYQGVKASLEVSERDRERLRRENDQYIVRLMRAKEEQVKAINEMNESMRKKGGALLPSQQAGSDLERKRKEEEDEKKRGELLAVDIDMTSSNAIIDQVAWQQHFHVTVPTERKRTVHAHRGQCMCVSYGPSGMLLVSGGTDGYVKVIDARSGIVKAQLRGSTDAIMHCSLSIDDSLLLAAGNDQTARVWALRPQASLAQQMTSGVKDVASTLDKTLQSLTDILPFGSKTTPPSSAPSTPSHSSQPAFSPATATPKAASPFSTSSAFPPRVIHTLNGHTNKIYAGCIDGASTRAFTGSHDRTIRVWDLMHGGACLKKVMCGSSCNHLSLSSGRSLELLASAHLDGHVRVWDTVNYELVKELDDVHVQQVTSVEWNRDAQLLVTTSRDNTVAVVDTRTFRTLHTLEGTTRDPYINVVNWSRACFSPDSQFVVAGGHLGTLYVWAADTGKVVATLNASREYDGSGASVGGGSEGWGGGREAPATAVTSVDWNRNGRQVIVSDLGGNVYFWE